MLNTQSTSISNAFPPVTRTSEKELSKTAKYFPDDFPRLAETFREEKISVKKKFPEVSSLVDAAVRPMQPEDPMSG